LTLVLTELSEAGIVMAADSAITKMRRNRITEVDQQGWQKVLKVPSIYAGISYWGMIGRVEKHINFDHWLQRVINNGKYHDLGSFVDYLVSVMNDKCGNKPLPDSNAVGLHVAGFAPWTDGIARPFFYHIHNGHGEIRISETEEEIDGIKRLVVRPDLNLAPRKLFEKHQDFPDVSKTLEENLEILKKSILTRNGDFFFYSVISSNFQAAIDYLNCIPDVSFPASPTKLASRKGFQHTMLETIIKFYRCSNRSKIIGGSVTSLGIGPNGYLPEPKKTSRGYTGV